MVDIYGQDNNTQFTIFRNVIILCIFFRNNYIILSCLHIDIPRAIKTLLFFFTVGTI